MDGPRKPLAVSSTGKVVATLSLMLMQRVRQDGNGHCPAIPRCHLLDVGLMQSVHLAIGDASEVRSYAHAPPPFKCIRANGLAPTQAGAMASIAMNWPQRSR